MSKDRRRHTRYAVTSSVRVVAGSKEVKGKTTNISGGGAAVRLETDLELGSSVTIDIEGVGSFKGDVVQRGNSTGIRFDVADEEAEEVANDLLRRFKGALPV